MVQLWYLNYSASKYQLVFVFLSTGLSRKEDRMEGREGT